MQKITTFLTYKDRAEDAVNFYTSIFKNSKIIDTRRYGDKMMTATFELEGQRFMGGWLTDKFGVSWQIIPSILGKLLGDKDPKKAGRVMQAMLQMDKIDIKRLQEAAEQG